VGGSATFGEHRRVGVETDRLLEQLGEPDGQDAGAAPAVEEPATPSSSSSWLSTASSCGE